MIQILSILHTHDINIICTQEDILLGSYPNIRPEYESIYTSYGYTAITHDILDYSKSKTLVSKYPAKQVYLGNVIYVRSTLEHKVNTLIAKPNPCPACIAQIQFDHILIANVHLCGGRYDDTLVFREPNFFRSKLESVRAIDHDIVCGDFNATRCLGEPGGLKNYTYPIELYKQYSKSKPTIDMISTWNTWQCSPIEFFFDQLYRSCFSDEQLDIIGETTNRGHNVVDWVFYDPRQIKRFDSHCEPMYDDSSHILSDHHMVMFKFSTNIKTEANGKSYYV